MAGLLRFLLSFRHKGVPGLRAGVLAGGAPRVYCLFGDRKWSCARRERWRVRGESAGPHPPVGARRGPEQAAPLWTSVSLQESWELMRLGSLTPAEVVCCFAATGDAFGWRMERTWIYSEGKCPAVGCHGL